MFEEDQDTEYVANTSDDSADKVEIEVSKTPPPRVLQSSTRARSQQLEKAIDNNAQENSGRRKKNKKKKHTRKSGKKGTGNMVSFRLPTQHSVRRDRVDENCRTLQIKYKRWEGGILPKSSPNVSHVRFSSESKIPTAQETPGNCVLCPLKKHLKDNWDKRWHYNSVHISKLIIVEEVCALKCKCSAVRSRGWAKDHSTRNSHYHYGLSLAKRQI